MLCLYGIVVSVSDIFFIVSEVFDHEVTVSPVFLDFDPELEIDFFFEHILDITACL